MPHKDVAALLSLHFHRCHMRIMTAVRVTWSETQASYLVQGRASSQSSAMLPLLWEFHTAPCQSLISIFALKTRARPSL